MAALSRYFSYMYRYYNYVIASALMGVFNL